MSNPNYYKLENLTILLIDDRRSMRSFIADVLREIGVGKILNAESYAEGLALLDPPKGMAGMEMEIPPSADRLAAGRRGKRFGSVALDSRACQRVGEIHARHYAQRLFGTREYHPGPRSWRQ